MSCLGPGYNPLPPRQWSRVQNRCPENVNGIVYIPQLKIYIPQSMVAYELQMIEKGNILQYKCNSSNLTKNQRYSQIAKGQWVNRTTTWASQTESVSEPNSTSLQRVAIKGNITVNGTPTTLPVTSCSKQVIPPVNFPSSGSVINKKNKVKKPQSQPQPKVKSNVNPTTNIPSPPLPPAPIVVSNGGSLIGTTTVNKCTGDIIKKNYVNNCNLTTASDVPGKIQKLCYNSGLATYYPKNRYTMNNSGNKWPQGVKFLRSANDIPSQ